jgi:hypothetical protein
MTFFIHPISLSEFDSLKEEWNSLLSRSADNNVFPSWEWLHTWWTLFNRHRQLFILTAREDERLIAVAPFYLDQPIPLGRHYLKLCTDELSPDYSDLIVENGKEEEALSGITRVLRRFANQWDIVALQHLRAETPFGKTACDAGPLRFQRPSIAVLPLYQN